jgi:phage protein D
MDRESKAAAWSDATDSDAVTTILSQYGYTPEVESTASQHAESKHTLVQRETDFRFVQRLARRSGFFFWVRADELGVETAYFKRPVLDGEAENKLTIHLSPPSFQSLDLAWDVERPTSASAAQLDLNTKEALDGAVTQSPLMGLAGQRLADIAPETRQLHLAAPVDDAGDLSARAEGALIEAEWFVRVQGQTSLHALGHLVRTHTVVELQGVGSRHSGKYFVGAVKHTISATGHAMDVELWRNGWEA